jgi:hypothetical protein
MQSTGEPLRHIGDVLEDLGDRPSGTIARAGIDAPQMGAVSKIGACNAATYRKLSGVMTGTLVSPRHHHDFGIALAVLNVVAGRAGSAQYRDELAPKLMLRNYSHNGENGLRTRLHQSFNPEG